MSVFSTNLEAENTRTSGFPGDSVLNNERTVSSWFVILLGKLGFYNKLGVAFRSLMATAPQGYDSYTYLVKRRSWDASTMASLGICLVYFSMMISIPTVIYKIQNSATSILQRKSLKLPLNSILLLFPTVIYTLNMLFIWFSPDININSAEVFHNALASFLTEFATLLILTLPHLLIGIMTSTFIHECEHFRQHITIEPKKEARRLLMLFRSIKDGCQVVLFVVFVGYTLTCIGVSYLVALNINGCLPGEQNIMVYANFTMLILVSALYLMYYAFTMENCFDEFIKIANTLRFVLPLMQ